MPYITKDRRESILISGDIRTDWLRSPGELNYAITELINRYLKNTCFPSSPRYDDFNDVMGVLESVKQEFYRRKVVPYEDLKIEENGDVY